MTGNRILEDRITGKLLVETSGSVGLITFNDPSRHNAVSLEVWADLPVALAALDANPEIRCVVLTGAGERAFVSGANIAQFDTLRSTADAVSVYEEAAEAAQVALYDFPKPTIARIRGYCLGGGLNLALCCDLRIASTDSSFSIPAGRLGLGYRMSAIRNLMQAVGAARALEIFLTATRYDAGQAHEMGLVQQVTPVDQLDVAVQAATSQIAGNAPLTLRAGKRMIRELQRIAPDIDTEAMRDLVMQCFASDDYREGKQAFAHKREPVFQGK